MSVREWPYSDHTGALAGVDSEPDRVKGTGMGLEPEGSLRTHGAGKGSKRRPRRRSANLLVLGTAVALLAPLTQTLLSGGPASASSSNANPTGVLKFGF